MTPRIHPASRWAALALQNNKDIRILVQPIWLRADTYEPAMKRPAKVDHNAITIEELWAARRGERRGVSPT